MPETFGSRLKHAWNVFLNKDPTEFIPSYQTWGASYSYRPDRVRLTRGNEKTICTAVYNRIAIDVASVTIQHVQLDKNGRYDYTMLSSLNDCLTLSPNIDQTAREFIQDVVLSMFDEGCVAIVPVDTDEDPTTGSFKVKTMRAGKVTQWYPKSVRVEVYNDRTGLKQEVMLPKSSVAIVENPFYSVMNEQNSTVSRLLRKLALLDIVDEHASSGKLDMIIQLPYIVKSDMKRAQALQRRKDLEDQLENSRYGIGYIDGTEKIVQLNRSVDNNLLNQIEYLYDLFYSQLCITKEIMNGTANEETMLNYQNRTIEPIVARIVDSMKRTFLTKTARTQGQSIMYFQDPFRLAPVSQIAEIADKFTRNEIMSSNEIRQIVGMKPSKDPKADELRNSNISQPAEETGQTNKAQNPAGDNSNRSAEEGNNQEEENSQNGET